MHSNALALEQRRIGLYASAGKAQFQTIASMSRRLASCSLFWALAVSWRSKLAKLSSTIDVVVAR